MCGGGSSGGGNDISYYTNIENDRRKEAEWAAKQAEEKARIEKEQLHRQFLFDRDQAATQAITSGRKYFDSLGYTSTSDDFISQIVNEAKTRIPTDDSNPGQYLTNDIFDSGIKKDEERQRTMYTGKVNSTFAPGYERSLISDTVDDDILNTILGEQSGSAQKMLQYNKDRGLLNDAGFNEALSRFRGQESAARSTLTGIGDATLGKVRSGIKDITGEAGTAASSWSFGTPSFDLTPYITRANDYATNAKTDLEGKIRSAVGSTQLFDIPSLIAQAGTAQGPMNLTTQGQDVMSPIPDAKKKAAGRGLGNVGVL